MEDGIFEKVKQYVSQEQEKDCTLAGLYLGDIAREMRIDEEDILHALALKANSGELVGADILISFDE